MLTVNRLQRGFLDLNTVDPQRKTKKSFSSWPRMSSFSVL